MAKADGLLPKFLHFQTHIKYTDECNAEVQLENVTDHDWVEVVRCVECIHYIGYRQDCGLYAFGKSDGLENPQPEDFCSRGERREPNDR